jgi:hypothetical protein
MLKLVVAALALLPFLALSQHAGAQGGAENTKAGMAVWDTGRAAAPVHLGDKDGWTAIAPRSVAVSFKGDAVLTNGRIAVVLRTRDATLEIHALRPEATAARVRLRLHTKAGEPGTRLERVALTENTKAGACLEAAFKTAKGDEIVGKFRLKRGEVSVQVEPGAGAGRLRVESPGRFVILPDFFADDIVIDAAKLPLESAELPSENFVLHPTAQGAAVALSVFENRKQDVKVTLAGTGARRQVTGSEIGFEGKKIWVALLEAPGIWHAHSVTTADKGKIVPLGWKMPFPAQWRVDFTRTGELTDSWEMLLQEAKDGDFVKPSLLGSGAERLPPSRRRWNTVLGTYPYPCWSSPDREGYVQPLKSAALQFDGPLVVYPLGRVKQTPLDVYTVVDVMRNTLGVGPCEHILDLEGQKSEYRGRATCSVRDTLNPIYAAHEQAKRRADVDKTLDEGLTFVKHIRGRITRYIDFGHKMRAYLAEERQAHPELADFIAEMDMIAQEINSRVAARAGKIQTPEHVAKMNEEFRKTVLGYEGPDALKRCQDYTRALVVIGDNQDELSGECRWVVKTLRQRAGILMALDPRAARVALEIRVRTQETLRNPAVHEGARH